MIMVILLQTSKSIVKEIHKFYHKLYSDKSCGQNCYKTNEKFLANIDIPKLSVESKDILDQPFSKKELYDSLMSMKQNKTPGYDGISN